MQERYNAFSDAVTQEFGEKLYKLSLSAGCTCPNRDGTLDKRGCIFCSAGGSGDFAESTQGSIHEQIERAKAQVQKKFKGEHYIAYFQSYTNTYGDVKRLSEIFNAAVREDCIRAISIGTRPDCLSDEILEMLEALQAEKPVFVELGLQTIHERTAEFIRRGYPLSVYDEAVKKLNAIGVRVVTHVILGLPGETREEMLETVRYVGESGAEGIKLQLLHILRGTDLETLYNKGAFQTMTLEEYADLLCDCIEILPPEIVIHRLTGDAPKKLLVEPLWSADKKRVLNTIQRTFKDRDVRQGAKTGCLL